MRKLLTLLCGACFLIAPGIVLGQSHDHFYQLETRLAEALKLGERERLSSLLAPDYSLTVAVAGGLIHVDRATWLENAVSNRELHGFEIHELVVRKYDGSAVVSSRYTGDATVNGVRRATLYFLTDIWVESEGDWLLSARYSSRPEGSQASPDASIHADGESKNQE